MRRFYQLFLMMTLFLLTGSFVFATTSFPEEVKCPVCGHKFEMDVLGSTNNLGGQDWDFLSRAGGAQPILIVPATCVKCFYSGYFSQFSNDDSITKDVKNKIKKDKVLKPLLEINQKETQYKIPAYVKYDLIAQVYILAGKDNMAIGDQYLNGSWAVRLRWWASDISKETQEEVNKIIQAHRKSKGRVDPVNDASFQTKIGYEIAEQVPRKSGKEKTYTALAAIELLKFYGENQAVIELMPVVKEGLSTEDYEKFEKQIMDSINQERYFQKKAVEYYLKGIPELKDEDQISSANYLLGELYRRLGENEKAKTYYKKSLEYKDLPEVFKTYIQDQVKKL